MYFDYCSGAHTNAPGTTQVSCCARSISIFETHVIYCTSSAIRRSWQTGYFIFNKCILNSTFKLNV